jgi:hypothetical protein
MIYSITGWGLPGNHRGIVIKMLVVAAAAIMTYYAPRVRVSLAVGDIPSHVHQN